MDSLEINNVTKQMILAYLGLFAELKLFVFNVRRNTSFAGNQTRYLPLFPTFPNSYHT